MSARILIFASLAAVAMPLAPRLTPDATAQHPTSITTDKGTYQVGDDIEICYTVPTPDAPIRSLASSTAHRRS
jgi:hypothetical protein